VNDEIGATIALGVDTLFARVPNMDITSQTELVEWYDGLARR
jgi:hypothetical protein